jgi:hypothetical protein
MLVCQDLAKATGNKAQGAKSRGVQLVTRAALEAALGVEAAPAKATSKPAGKTAGSKQSKTKTTSSTRVSSVKIGKPKVSISFVLMLEFFVTVQVSLQSDRSLDVGRVEIRAGKHYWVHPVLGDFVYEADYPHGWVGSVTLPQFGPGGTATSYAVIFSRPYDEDTKRYVLAPPSPEEARFACNLLSMQGLGELIIGQFWGCLRDPTSHEGWYVLRLLNYGSFM